MRSVGEVQARAIFVHIVELIWDVVGQYKKLTMRSFVIDPAYTALYRKIATETNTKPGEIVQVISLDDIETSLLRGNQTGEMVLKSDLGDFPFTEICPDVMIANYPGKHLPLTAFNVSDSVGEGGFATVKKGIWEGKHVAVKIIKINSEASKRELMAIHISFRREILAQSSFTHPNIVYIYAICLNPLAVALEFCSLGDLNVYLAKPASDYGWKLALKIARDIGCALQYMQENFTPPWAHLDFKSPYVFMYSMVVHIHLFNLILFQKRPPQV